MPLVSGDSQGAISRNINELMRKYHRTGTIGTSTPESEEKARKQAAAIALSKAREKRATDESGIRKDLKNHERRDEKWEQGVNSKLKSLVTMEKKEHMDKKATMSNKYLEKIAKMFTDDEKAFGKGALVGGTVGGATVGTTSAIGGAVIGYPTGYVLHRNAGLKAARKNGLRWAKGIAIEAGKEGGKYGLIAGGVLGGLAGLGNRIRKENLAKRKK